MWLLIDLRASGWHAELQLRWAKTRDEVRMNQSLLAQQAIHYIYMHILIQVYLRLRVRDLVRIYCIIRMEQRVEEEEHTSTRYCDRNQIRINQSNNPIKTSEVRLKRSITVLLPSILHRVHIHTKKNIHIIIYIHFERYGECAKRRHTCTRDTTVKKYI